MQGKQAKILSPTQERAILGYLVTTRYGVPVVLERLWEAFHNCSAATQTPLSRRTAAARCASASGTPVRRKTWT